MRGAWYNIRMHPKYLKANELTKEVIDAALTVQRYFGIGVLESIYVKALSRELELAGHKVEEEKPCTIEYKGRVWNEKLRADLIVDDCLLIEAKAIEPCDLQPARMQALSYMRLLDYPLGLVINFGDEHLAKRGIKRVILKGADEEDDTMPF